MIGLAAKPHETRTSLAWPRIDPEHRFSPTVGTASIAIEDRSKNTGHSLRVPGSPKVLEEFSVKDSGSLVRFLSY
jgi:hypothetical protein